MEASSVVSDVDIMTFADRVLSETPSTLRLTPVNVSSLEYLGPSARLVRLQPERYVAENSEDQRQVARMCMLLDRELQKQFKLPLMVRLQNLQPDELTLRLMIEKCQAVLLEKFGDSRFFAVSDRCAEFCRNSVPVTAILISQHDAGLTEELERAVGEMNEALFCGASDNHPLLMAVDARLDDVKLVDQLRKLLTTRDADQEQTLNEAGVSEAFRKLMTNKPSVESIRIRHF